MTDEQTLDLDLFGQGAALLNEQGRKMRLPLIIAKWLDDPLTTRREMAEYIEGGCGGIIPEISKSGAYRYIEEAMPVLARIKNASKQWIRHITTEHFLEAIKKAKEDGNTELVVTAVSKLAKYYKLDKDDAQQQDWDALPEPSFEVTGDIAALGIESISAQEYQRRRDALRKKYNAAQDGNDND